jgi:16S rRNA (guanine966-N2)-methyltransferase
MRVTGGRLAGRRLRVPRGDRVRPTADRVRESLFAHLDHRGALVGRRVLDLFAGSGALGIEALSRGAREAVFVERVPPVVAALRANLEALDLAAEARVVRADVRSALRRLAAAGERFELILLDPPYGDPHLAEILEGLAAVLARGGEVWLESARRDPLPSPPGLAILDARSYGDTRMTHWGRVDEDRAGPAEGMPEGGPRATESET